MRVADRNRRRSHPRGLRRNRTGREAGLPGLLRSALDALPAHVCVLDADATVLWVNRAWRQFSALNGGNETATGEGSNYLAVCAAACGPQSNEAPAFGFLLREVLAGRRAHFEVEYPCHSPTELRWFVAGAALIEGPGPGRVIVSHQSVTARRLADARERERQRLETLGALAGGIAHDFNNVLGAVLGHAALLLEATPGGSQEHEPLKHIQRAALRGRDLVRRLMAFGRGPVAAEAPLALAPLVEETLALLATSCPPGARQVLELASGADALWVRGDATELQRSLMNLVQNAWLALQGGPGTVTVSLRPSAEGSAELRVADSGCGIPAALHGRIFEPFFTTRPVGEGTGLGLAQVHSMVTLMGGRIDVRSELAAGSIFTLTLPLCDAPAAQAQVGPAQAPVARAAPATLLLVDDDEVVGLANAALLARAGHRVQRTTSAHDALRELDRDGATFCALVSDHAMPEMSGLELCRAARALRPSLPLLIVTGYINEALMEGAVALGAAVLPKEEAFERLEGAVASLLQPAASTCN
jgi:signal transduction histidine kinase